MTGHCSASLCVLANSLRKVFAMTENPPSREPGAASCPGVNFASMYGLALACFCSNKFSIALG